jgi:hypothetical protein
MADHDTEIASACRAVRADLRAAFGPRSFRDARRAAEIDQHLEGCPGCRVVHAALDPAAIFQELRGQELPGDFWAGFDRTLRTRLEAESGRRRAGWLGLGWSGARLPHPALLAAPLAMVLVFALTMTVMRPGRHDSALPSPYAPPAGARREAVRFARPTLTAAAPGVLPAAVEPPALEEVASPAARVYRFDAGDADATAIYMVVDETIDF